MKAIFKKKSLFSLRNPYTFIFQFFFPTLFLCYALYSQYLTVPKEASMELSLKSYGEDIINLLAVQKGSDLALVQRYEQQMNGTGEFRHVPDMNSHIFNMSPMDYEDFKYRALAGALITPNRTLAFFSNEPYHSIPISLTGVYNALIQTKNPGAPRLVFENHPIPQRLSGTEQQFAQMFSYYSMTIMLSFGIIATASGLCEVYVQERENGVMNMQFISGISPDLYWVFSFAFDMLVYGLSVSTVILILLWDHATPKLWQFFQILFLFGFSALPFGYLRARRYKKPADVNSDLQRFGYVSLIAYFTLYVGACTLGYMNQEKVEMFFMIMPHFNLVDGVLKYTLAVAGLQEIEVLWKNKLMFGVSGFLCLLLVILHDTQDMQWLYRWFRWNRGDVHDVVPSQDNDVLREEARVDAMSEDEVGNELVVAKHLRKKFGKTTAVKDATFVLER